MNINELLVWALRLTGVGQIFVAGVTFWLREIIGWEADLKKLRPLNRCIVGTYGYYIQTINAVFGLICLCQARDLLDKTSLAADLTLLMGVYWLGRLVLGLFYYDNREITRQRVLYRFGEYAFNLLFIFQVTTLLAAFAQDVGWLA